MKVINKKRILIGFLSVIVLTIMMCSLVSAIGLSLHYHNLNYLKVESGETKEEVFGRFQNTEEDDVILDIELVEGNEIAKLTDPNLNHFIVPAGRLDIPLNIRVSIPEDAIKCSEYKISIRYKQITISEDPGMIIIIESKTSSIPVLVEKIGEDNCVNITNPGATEVCNNVDDDCDGEVDENWPELGDSCTVGLGECESSGLMICTADGLGTKCDATEGQSTEEICDGLDNDCDGEIDEDLTQSTNELGACSINTETCSAGSWIENSGNYIPESETCNNIDDDCDGNIDGNTQPTTCGVGECAGTTGTETCILGVWKGNTCNPFEGALDETCDGLDNDCDGKIDNVDADEDGFNDCTEDKCPNTEEEQVVYGCSCEQILDLKPGKAKSSKCNPGLMNVFNKEIGWARDLP